MNQNRHHLISSTNQSFQVRCVQPGMGTLRRLSRIVVLSFIILLNMASYQLNGQDQPVVYSLTPSSGIVQSPDNYIVSAEVKWCFETTTCKLNYSTVPAFGQNWDNTPGTDMPMTYNSTTGKFEANMGILPPGKYEFGCSCLCGGTPFSYGNGNGSLEIKEPETAAPVTLSYFNVSNTGKIKLSWQTASESNNDYFEILYSRTGKDFQVIGKVKGAGNSNAIQQYEFIDNVTSASGRSFYRLRQVDTDGKYSYSPVRSVTTKNKMTEILLAPNPTSDLVTVIQDGSYTSMEIYVRDMTGKLMAHYQNHDSETIDFTSFPSGIYAVNIVTEEGVVSKKVARR